MQHEENLNLDTPIVRAVRAAYRSGQEDEALEPIVAGTPAGRPLGRMAGGDYVIFYDIRGEREIQLTRSLTEADFSFFPRPEGVLLNFVTMIEYSSSLKARAAFPPEGEIRGTLGETLSRAGLRFCKIAESEKAVHVGYFLNGKREDPFPGEERVIVPSPEVDSYAEVPEMSASEVSDRIMEKLEDPGLPFVLANLANVDVVGHIENRDAVIRAVESVDRELGRIVDACRRLGITLLVTADHGTVEEWLYPDGQIDTGHTRNPVPFVLADFSAAGSGKGLLRRQGELTDVAPTVLDLLNVGIPREMTGQSLLDTTAAKMDRRVLLLILDGWGMREEERGNLILEAATPHFDGLWAEFPGSLLKASGEAVGMPEGTVGNSESGHLHLGSGRRIFLDRVKIDRAIHDGAFDRNPEFLWAMDHARDEGRALHLLGIVSHYSSHGSIRHLNALINLAASRGVSEVYIHALIGRRGERPESGAVYVAKVEDMCRRAALGRVATVIGRFWALDREENWDRIEKTYRTLVKGEGTLVF
jgi:2,3-bisphosphoglycerate-independent phosphoglycerate mutase